MFFCCDYLLSGIFKIFLSKFCNEIVHLEMKTTIYMGTQGKGGMGAAQGGGGNSWGERFPRTIILLVGGTCQEGSRVMEKIILTVAAQRERRQRVMRKNRILTVAARRERRRGA